MDIIDVEQYKDPNIVKIVHDLHLLKFFIFIKIANTLYERFFKKNGEQKNLWYFCIYIQIFKKILQNKKFPLKNMNHVIQIGFVTKIPINI